MKNTSLCSVYLKMNLVEVGRHMGRFQPCSVSRSMMWYELYSCEIGRKKWKPRLFETLDSVSADVQDVPAATWKKMLFSEMGYHEDAVWKKHLRHMNLKTGMPAQTEQVLRSDTFLVLSLRWRVLFRHGLGKRERDKSVKYSSVCVLFLCGVCCRSLRVVWEITLTRRSGKYRVYEQSQAFFSTSSVTVCWSGGVWPLIHHVLSVQLHGVLRSPTAIPAK